VGLCGVYTLDVIDVNVSVSILVKFVKSLGYRLLSVSVHRSSNGSDEFIIANRLASVYVEVGIETFDFGIAEAKHVIFHGLGKLVDIEGSVVVVVHNSELFAETNDASSSSRS